MPDYTKGKIYTIRCRTDDTLIYVGSTIQPLSVRFGGHKVKSNNAKYQNNLLYRNINHNWDNWYIELYEENSCENKEQLGKREGEVIRLIGTLNSAIAGRSRKEWRHDNKDKISEQQKQLYEANKEYRLEYQRSYYNKKKNNLTDDSTECITH